MPINKILHTNHTLAQEFYQLKLPLDIDGTKIESCANKYTFVWKKAVTKNLAKLLVKLADFVANCEEQYGIKVVYQNQVSLQSFEKTT